MEVTVKGELRPACPEFDLASLYKEQFSLLCEKTYVFVKCRQTSEDIVQDVFFKLSFGQAQLKEIKDIHSYLFLMCRNLAVTELRRRRRERKIFEEVSFNQNFMEFDMLLQKELNQTIEQAIHHLPVRQQLVYKLGREEKWCRNKISVQLNIKPVTVKATMQNALKSIKKHVIKNWS